MVIGFIRFLFITITIYLYTLIYDLLIFGNTNKGSKKDKFLSAILACLTVFVGWLTIVVDYID